MSILKKLAVGACILTAMAPNAFAQDWSKLNNYLDSMDKYERFMGSVAIRKQGEVIYQKTTGFKDYKNQLKAQNNDKYRIGSITKTFTATLVLKAVEAGKLSLDDVVTKYFPQWNKASNITVKDLLGHTSGIENITNKSSYLSFYTKPHTSAQLLDSIQQFSILPVSAPTYSNTNYILLTFILEKVYHKSFEEILNTQIVKPLQLKHTGVGSAINTSKGFVHSYTYLNGWQQSPETHMSVPQGAGNITSTPADLTRFFQALFKGEIINASSLALMKTINQGFGLGLFQYPFNNEIGYGHDGGIDGFASSAAYFEKDGIAIAITSNGNRYNINDVALAMLSVVNGLPFEVPTFSNYKADPSVEETYIGAYASEKVPLIIHVFKKDGALYAQAEGQSDFPLYATALHQYEFAAAGIKISFYPEKRSLVLNQGNIAFEFIKK